MAGALNRRIGIAAIVGAALAVTLAACQLVRAGTADGADWTQYGGGAGQQHYSPLDEINQDTVARLGLQWSLDLPFGNTNTQPIAVDGILYFATGLSVVHAVDAVTGKPLWQYDPGVGDKAGLNMRFGWGVRGIASWEGKIFTGTQDGRLIAIDASSGKPVWTAQTFQPDQPAYISGAPRVFDGKVLVGFGSTTGAIRGYVTAYDAASGKQLWRFHTVPGNPADGFENEAMAMAAKTWAGKWWEFGGGGTVWNSMAYDAETDTVFIGVGSGYPWNRRKRSADDKGDRGDNLFLCSIVALDGKTGAYKWHYQVVPGDTWDFDATMDIELADLEIDGKLRKVIVQAPKNGFFYVIDRTNGKLISAEPYAQVNWATGIDKKTGRPIEVPGMRYGDGKSVLLRPTAMGAHSWMPMAFSAQTGLVYIPKIEFAANYSDASKTWRVPSDRTVSGAVDLAGGQASGMTPATGSLLAWSPVQKKAVWEVPYPTHINGGILATAGKLVFQGTIDGTFKAYAADTGKVVWQFKAGAPLIATPITFSAGGRQYVTLLTGLGMNHPAAAPAITGPGVEAYGIDPRTQARRVLTFAIGGTATVPASASAPAITVPKGLTADAARAAKGAMHFATHCATCHGSMAIGISQAPDLRRSALPLDRAAFSSVVKDGALEPAGMPAFGEFPADKIEDLRQYILMTTIEAQRGAGKSSLPVPSGLVGP